MPMGSSASVWPLAMVPAMMLTSWKLWLLASRATSWNGT